MPERRVIKESDGWNCPEDSVVLNPQENAEADQWKKFEAPASSHKEKNRGSQESDDGESEILEKIGSNLVEARAIGNGFSEVFMELISLSFVLVEEPSLKYDSCDNECLSKESDECHMF